VPVQYKAHVFRSPEWETLDSYWNSPFSYWAMKGMRVDPTVSLRVKVLGSVMSESEEGWINYGGAWAMLVQTVQARGTVGQKIRIVIEDEAILEDGDPDDE
jgi:hypothetical protein